MITYSPSCASYSLEALNNMPGIFMPINANALQLQWSFADVDSIEDSQRWVLTAMSRHGTGLITMLWRILGNEQDVCDAYQQTFLALAHNPDIKKPRNVKAYLFRTASNIASTMLRKLQVSRKSMTVIAASVTDEDTLDYAADLDARELSSKLRATIARLPDYLKEVVILRDLAEMPYSQIAKILGISASSARVYRSKGVTLLASWMSNKQESRC
jgi:RNA polymerase sigma factor (sigma-70 family)